MLLLRKLRIDRCLSVEDVASATGVPIGTIYNLERESVKNPRPSTLAPLVEYFGQPGSALLAHVLPPLEEAA